MGFDDVTFGEEVPTVSSTATTDALANYGLRMLANMIGPELAAYYSAAFDTANDATVSQPEKIARAEHLAEVLMASDESSKNVLMDLATLARLALVGHQSIETVLAKPDYNHGVMKAMLDLQLVQVQCIVAAVTLLYKMNDAPIDVVNKDKESANV